jgi:hypothetical protein
VTAKIAVVESLGERTVLLPALIAEALAANERLKLRLSVLQEAALQAAQPGRPSRDFNLERRAAGLSDPALDGLVSGARVIAPGHLFLPGVDVLLGPVGDDLAAMLAPLKAADAETSHPLAERVERVRKSLPAVASGELTLAEISALTSVSPAGTESLHRLVMDLHQALNRLAAATAAQTVEGARVHGLADADRPRVVAFMRGLHRTAHLTFGHPGLGTTAVSAGGRLTIQNDLGTTEAHVLVIHVTSVAVTITYTDVHHPRARFFISLFAGQGVAWSPLGDKATGDLAGDSFYLLTGRYAASDQAALERFLEFLGSRLVFVIDWNKARKALQTFVGKAAAFELLVWAAEQNFGHRAFLELGGADLVFATVQSSAAGRIPYGVRLDTALGTIQCVHFLRQVLRDTSQGLAAGRSARLVRDEIQADLAHGFETAASSVLTILVRHLGLSRMLAGTIADIFAAPALTTASERRAFAMRAKAIEEKGDRLTVEARELAARLREASSLRPLIDEVENAMDALEDCAFFVGLLPEAEAARLDAAPLARLAGIATGSVGDLVRAVEAASRLPEGERADAVAALQSIDAVVVGERSADQAERDTFAAVLLAPPGDVKSIVLGIETARALETATDYLSHSALLLRDRVLEELSA